MSKFADRMGHEWTVEITSGHLKPLRRDFGIDLRDALKSEGEKNSLAEAIGDPEKFEQMLWVLCGDQATAAGIEPEDFAYRFNGEATRNAALAVWEATLDFFQGGKAAKNGATAFRNGMDQAEEMLGRAWQIAADSLNSNDSAENSEAVLASTHPPTA